MVGAHLTAAARKTRVGKTHIPTSGRAGAGRSQLDDGAASPRCNAGAAVAQFTDSQRRSAGKLLIAQAVAEAAQNATANQVRYELVPQVKKGQVSAMFEDEAKRWPSALRSWRTG
jgi:hypothetical protein